jgi:hypothetical protein
MREIVCQRNQSTIAIIFLSLTLACSAVQCQATAADQKKNLDASGASNIFSTPDSEAAVPTFTPAGGRGQGKMRQLIYGEGKNALPSFQQVRAIPSLSPQQRRAMKKIYADAKVQAAPLMDQMKQLRSNEQSQGRLRGDEQSQDPMPRRLAPQNRAKFSQLRNQLLSLRTATWNKVKANLTPQQLEELNAMKKGELPPATFNEPAMNGPGGD